MNKYDVERAKARRAPEVATNRSRKKASIKRGMTMTAKAAVATAVVGVGTKAVNSYLSSRGMQTINADSIMRYANKAKKFMQYI